MSLMFVDSFDMTPPSVDIFTTTDSWRKWLNNTSIHYATGGRRNGGWINTGYTNRMLYGFTGISGLIFGAAIKQADAMLGTFAANSSFLLFGYDEYWFVEVRTTDSGAFLVMKKSFGSAGNEIGWVEIGRTRDGVFHSGGWYHMEIKYIHGASGMCHFRVNDEPLIEFNGDTRWQPVVGTVAIPTTFNWMGLGSYQANTAPMGFDDVYLCNDQGSVNNDFLGDCRVDVVYPIANSTPLQFTPSAAGDNYTMVNETQWNNTNYVSSSTTGQQDMYAFGDVTSSSDVYYGIQINAVARKSDAGPRRMKILTKSGGVTYASGDYYVNEGTWIDHLQIRETNPATGTAWTDASINNAEFGVEVV